MSDPVERCVVDDPCMTTTETYSGTWSDIELGNTSGSKWLSSSAVLPKGDYVVSFRYYPSVTVSTIGASFACMVEREARKATFAKESHGIPFSLETVSINPA